MVNIEPDVREQPSKKDDGNVAIGILNKIAAAILGLGAVIAALTYLLGNFNGFVNTAKKAYPSLTGGLTASPPNPSMLKNKIDSHLSDTSAIRPTPKPGPNCVEVQSVDYSVVPAKYVREWSCPE